MYSMVEKVNIWALARIGGIFLNRMGGVLSSEIE